MVGCRIDLNIGYDGQYVKDYQSQNTYRVGPLGLIAAADLPLASCRRPARAIHCRFMAIDLIEIYLVNLSRSMAIEF
jgi:hypothetical protein